MNYLYKCVFFLWIPVFGTFSPIFTSCQRSTTHPESPEKPWYDFRKGAWCWSCARDPPEWRCHRLGWSGSTPWKNSPRIHLGMVLSVFFLNVNPFFLCFWWESKSWKTSSGASKEGVGWLARRWLQSLFLWNQQELCVGFDFMAGITRPSYDDAMFCFLACLPRARDTENLRSLAEILTMDTWDPSEEIWAEATIQGALGAVPVNQRFFQVVTLVAVFIGIDLTTGSLIGAW